jgi:phospholipid/cholesterol/gamma-HCH transport system permease protein
MFQNLGEMLMLLGETLGTLPRFWQERRKVAEQLFDIGNSSLFMACMLALFMGGVLSLQTGPVLVQRGLGSSLGGLVALALCKELAPVMMAVLIAGRIGSSMAAELGSMQVYQEIDALRTLNINPIRYLVFPRVVAIAVALPCLVIFANLVGWMGGALVAQFNSRVGVSWNTYFSNLRATVEWMDLANGLIKSFFFAVVVGVVSCHQGLTTRGGPRGIGRSVTKAVVNSIVLILILDYALTRLLLPLDNGWQF